MSEIKHISNFSGGLCSFWATMRAIEANGKDNVVALFADTLYEHPDLYDFNRRAEDVMGIPITRICVGLTPWQLFRREGLIGNDRFPICSTKLKREPLNSWMETYYEMDHRQENLFKPKAEVVLGFDFTEYNRVADFQNQHLNWTVEAPMTDEPLWDKCKMLREALRLGFKEPELYALGFPHNNCGGGCVKAGISHFVHLYHVLPEVFNKWETEEQETLTEFSRRGISRFTILKDRRGGETMRLSLLDLRLRIESGEKFSRTDWGGCGCGGASEINLAMAMVRQ